MILVFGSINIDVIVPVPALPGPGETVLGGDYALLPGGKGANQALAALRAGTEVMMAGAVGEDGFADAALELLRREGVDLSLVRRVNRPTGCAGRQSGSGCVLGTGRFARPRRDRAVSERGADDGNRGAASPGPPPRLRHHPEPGARRADRARSAVRCRLSDRE